MNQRRIEPFESPKILGDVFESIMGAVYQDGGLDEVHRVYKHLLAPLILYNTQFGKLPALYGEPKEQFQMKCHEFKIKPQYRFLEEPKMTVISEECSVMMYTCEVIFRNGQTMVSSIGSTKQQAERNASVTGIIWLETHKDELQFYISAKKKGGFST
jgi:dsRNA-specific ribonuclease